MIGMVPQCIEFAKTVRSMYLAQALVDSVEYQDSKYPSDRLLFVKTEIAGVAAQATIYQPKSFWSAHDLLSPCRSLRYLLDKKNADPNYVLPIHGTAAIHRAASLADEKDAIRILLMCVSFGGSLECRTTLGHTPLHIAAIHFRMSTLRLLWNTGGNLNQVDSQGFTVLDYLINAIRSGEAPPEVMTFMEVLKGKDHTALKVNRNLAYDFRQKNNYSNSDYYDKQITSELAIDTMNNAFIINCSLDWNFHFTKSITYSDIGSETYLVDMELLLKDALAKNMPSLAIDYAAQLPLTCPWSPNQRSSEENGMSLGLCLANFKSEIQRNCFKRLSFASRQCSTIDSHIKELEFFTCCSHVSDSTLLTDHLKLRLQKNYIPYGPIVKSTKRVYLTQLQKVINGKMDLPSNIASEEFNDVITSTLNGRLVEYIQKWSSLEYEMIELFENGKPEHKLDSSKHYFTYLLLDPTVYGESKILPSDLNESWTTFLRAVFYVGKGKYSRPFDHLLEAVKSNEPTHSAKINKIKNVWSSGVGIVCVHIFHNITEAEALTREACMISSLSTARLTNIQKGKCYKGVEKWGLKKKRKLGVVLLYRSMMLLVAEGGRQIFPSDLKK